MGRVGCRASGGLLSRTPSPLLASARAAVSSWTCTPTDPTTPPPPPPTAPAGCASPLRFLGRITSSAGQPSPSPAPRVRGSESKPQPSSAARPTRSPGSFSALPSHSVAGRSRCAAEPGSGEGSNGPDASGQPVRSARSSDSIRSISCIAAPYSLSFPFRCSATASLYWAAICFSSFLAGSFFKNPNIMAPVWGRAAPPPGPTPSNLPVHASLRATETSGKSAGQSTIRLQPGCGPCGRLSPCTAPPPPSS